MYIALFWISVAVAFLLGPSEYDGDGILTTALLTLAVFIAITPIAVHYAILRSLPERVGVSDASRADVPGDLDRLVYEYETQGFQRVLTPLRFHLPDEVLLVPLLHDLEPMWATVCRIQSGKRRRLAFDVVSVFEGRDCTLTTSMDPGAGVLPAGPGTLRQILPEASPDDLVAFHREALRTVLARGVAPLDVAPHAMAGLLKRSFARNRRLFLQKPVRNTFAALWRTITKRNPHLGMLSEQEGFARSLVRSGAHSRQV